MPKPPHFRYFVSPFISSYWVEIETSNLVVRLTVASASLKGAWSDHVNHLNFGDDQPYLRNDWS